MPGIKLSRIATTGIIVSLAYTLLGIIIHEPPALFHPSLAGLGGLLVFPTAMYIVFTGSLKSGRPRTGLEAAVPSLAVALTGLAPLVAVFMGSQAASIMAAAGLGSLAVHTLFQIRGWRRPESRILLLYPPLAGAIAYTLAAVSPYTGSLTPPSIAGLVYAASMIYLVSLYTIARNYGTSPTMPWVHVPFLIHTPTIPLAYTSNIQYMTTTAALAGLAYMTITGYPQKVTDLIQRARRLKEPARSTLHYTLASHTVAYASLLLALITALTGDTLAGLHYVTLGFAGAQILLHAPLMLPQVTGVVLNKDYKPIPLVLILAAAIARDHAPWASTMIVILALAEAAVQFRPRSKITSR